MAKVKITGHASGTGVITVTAPNTNTDRTITLPDGDVTLGAGIDWQSSIVTGTTLTAVAGKGYWINTTSNICTITLPSSASVGDQLVFTDYARTWETYKIVINSNGLNYQGSSGATVTEYTTSGQSLYIVYSGATKGWIPNVDVPTVSDYTVDFLVIAGGGSGGTGSNGIAQSGGGGGGGAGGYRNSYNSETSGGGGSSETALSLTPEIEYIITVGSGASGNSVPVTNGVNGNNSVFYTVISQGGGGGGNGNNGATSANDGTGAAGGSGGGSGEDAPGGSGTANQGYSGGAGSVTNGGGTGGGGAGAAGGVNSSGAGAGGNGVASSINASSTTRAGGGGGAENSGGGAAGGSGGGGAGGQYGGNGSVNTGSGGGGATDQNPRTSGNGGSGLVILSMLDADYSGTSTGSPTVATGVSGKTVLTFTGSGTYTG